MQNNDNDITNRRPIGFKQFKDYCEKIVPILNTAQIAQKQNAMHYQSEKQIISYTASYKILNMKFAKQHDCQYLEIQQLSQTNCVNQHKINPSQQHPHKVLLKINIIYSLPYQIPLLLFMPYHLIYEKYILQQVSELQEDGDVELKPFTNEQINQVINTTIGSQKMNPVHDETGVFIIQNPINKEYFYTLHHCYMDTHQMTINQIIPYYLAIIGCHPQIML